MSEQTIKTKGVSNNRLIGKEVSLPYSSISAQVSFLQGKVLTVIDASFPTGDDRQLKAVKDLIKSAFGEQLSWICELCYPDLPMKSEDSLKAQGIDTDAVKRGAVEISL